MAKHSSIQWRMSPGDCYSGTLSSVLMYVDQPLYPWQPAGAYAFLVSSSIMMHLANKQRDKGPNTSGSSSSRVVHTNAYFPYFLQSMKTFARRFFKYIRRAGSHISMAVSPLCQVIERWRLLCMSKKWVIVSKQKTHTRIHTHTHTHKNIITDFLCIWLVILRRWILAVMFC